ncbi:MAG: acyl-CoA thioesterase [Candidatus Limnocylindria bacterium]
MTTDLWTYTTRLRVRWYEVDYNGHVNNAVYLNWIAQLAAEHADACGFGREWSHEHGGVWVVRRHDITYHTPALNDDELELTVRVQSLGGVRGVRRTDISRPADRARIADCTTEWVWVRVSDGRPARVPAELIAAYDSGGAR